MQVREVQPLLLAFYVLCFIYQPFHGDIPAAFSKSCNDCNLQAFTWSGFEDGTTFMGGLWTGRNTQEGDFATLVYRAQLYGFNAVRLPFRWAAFCNHLCFYLAFLLLVFLLVLLGTFGSS